ncbi:hypothetical protein BDZ97DRAFT_1781063 [Flammula alnicola]|nr:hypothetical protein BDZ97DRAFT_1781063 [Flammula alnicola]
MDIVTHLAICVSQDWNKVDRIVVGNFFMANQVERKWCTQIITKVSSGDYKLGANSANIIVKNRMTGWRRWRSMFVLGFGSYIRSSSLPQVTLHQAWYQI